MPPDACKMRSRRFLHPPRQNLPASVWLDWLFLLAAVLAAGKSLQGVPSVRICCTSGLEPDILRPWHSGPPRHQCNILPTPAFKETTTHVALPEQSLKNEKRMKQVPAHACIYHGVAITCSVWVRAYVGNYKMATAKSRTLQVLSFVHNVQTFEMTPNGRVENGSVCQYFPKVRQ